MLIIMQGPSGSGKTTIAKKLAKKYDAVIYSTDDYFYNDDGDYNYNPKMFAAFHRKNQYRSIQALREGKSVIVDNTNIQRWECKPYVEAAVDLQIDILFVRADGDFDSIHNVPREKIREARKRMEELTVESVLKSRAPWER